jgi:DNA-binding NtrC family response regulator
MNKEAGEIADEALQCLSRHTWPGNVRELQNVIERAIIRSSGRICLPREITA